MRNESIGTPFTEAVGSRQELELTPERDADMPEPIPDELVQAVHERRAMLFAGAGLSMSVGLPSWREFIEHVGVELGLDAEDVLGPDTSYHTLAEYFRIRKGSIGPLRAWMQGNWRVSEESVRRSRLHQLVVALDFPIIYTTNYDPNIEAAFAAHGREYVKIADERDIAAIRDGVTQIVKFHGDFDDEGSLVITESDYFERLAFEAPLDVKFRADALAKTILFIGYSMTDLDIRLLLHNLRRTWRRSGHERHRPPSYVFMTRPNAVHEAILTDWGISVLSGPCDDPESALISFLEELHQRATSSSSVPS
jgi:hypothetical protein